MRNVLAFLHLFWRPFRLSAQRLSCDREEGHHVVDRQRKIHDPWLNIVRGAPSRVLDRFWARSGTFGHACLRREHADFWLICSESTCATGDLTLDDDSVSKTKEACLLKPAEHIS